MANGAVHVDFARARAELVGELRARGVTDRGVLAAFRRVPRERFVSPELAAHAYADVALSIGEGQTISQPFLVAVMTEALALRRGERVLEIGTGSGYQAAILAELGAEVFTIERLPRLAEKARATLRALGYRRVHVRVGDGLLGDAGAAPYDGILVTAGAPAVPLALVAQLAVGGRLVVPAGALRAQRLVRVTRLGARPDEVRTESLLDVTFVSLVGE